MRNRLYRNWRLQVLQIAPALIFILFWEFTVRRDLSLKFFFGSPKEVVIDLIRGLVDGSLARDALVTFTEAGIGFVLGNLAGTVLGLLLWFSRTAMKIARPYVLVLGSAPIFAFAPLLIIWFGTGLLSKVMIATLSTVFIALTQAYSGASEVNDDYLRLMKTLGATRVETFRKIVVPSSLVWVISAFKLNIGFALLGAFIGEFVSSNEGLGHEILVATGLFDISQVLASVSVFCLLAFLLNLVVSEAEPRLKHIIARYI